MGKAARTAESRRLAGRGPIDATDCVPYKPVRAASGGPA